MSIPKDEFKCNPAAKQLWATLNEKHNESLVKPKRSVVAALRRLISTIDRNATTPIVSTCPLTGYVTAQLCLTCLSEEDQNEILNTWEWLIGLKG